MNLFKHRNLQEMTVSMANYLPGGKLFTAKFNPKKNLYKFIEGLSVEASRANDLLITYNNQYYPDETIDFVSEWEKALGIPDSCITIEGVIIEDRRLHMLTKLAGMAVQTAKDFEEVALAFGISATVVGGKDPSVSPVITPDKTARFTIVVQFGIVEVFPFTFPISFGNDEVSLLTCIFNKLRPANCQVIFQSV